MSFGIVLEFSTCALNGNDIFFRDRFETTTDTIVTTINVIDKYGLLKGLNEQSPKSDKSQIDLLHHDIGISCTARIRASGKYEPIKIIKADRTLNCTSYYHFYILQEANDW